MKIKSLFKNVEYIGQAEGDRRTYHVFGGIDSYLVVAPNGRDGLNVNVVDAEVAQVISKRFAGQRVTGRRLKKEARRPDLFGRSFAPLNSLYVMVALKRAKKLRAREGRAMIFKIR